jgi:hypothetical protein
MKKQVKRGGFTAFSTESSLSSIDLGIERPITGRYESKIVTAIGSGQYTNGFQDGNIPDECLLTMLRAENAELRNQVVELALEILELQIGPEADTR